MYIPLLCLEFYLPANTPPRKILATQKRRQFTSLQYRLLDHSAKQYLATHPTDALVRISVRKWRYPFLHRDEFSTVSPLQQKPSNLVDLQPVVTPKWPSFTAELMASEDRCGTQASAV